MAREERNITVPVMVRGWEGEGAQSTYFTVRGQSYFSRLPKYWPPIPLSARRVCPLPATKAGGTHSPGGEGDWGSIFWKTREIGLPSYSKICTLWEGVLVAGLQDCKNISSPKPRVVISYKFFVLHKFIEELGSPTKIHIPVTDQVNPAVILWRVPLKWS